jgi:hypothetical protein
MKTRQEKMNATGTETKRGLMNCYLQVIGRNFVQESYDTMSGDARRRAAQLRKAGFLAKTRSLGMQVTDVGRVRMSLVDVRFAPGYRDDVENLPVDGWKLVQRF